MDKSRKTRFERIRKFDERQLDVVVNELRKLELTLTERCQIKKTLQDQLRNSLLQTETRASVASQQQSIEWATRSQLRLAQLDGHLQSLKEKRTELLEGIRQQKAKVKGWDLLLARIAAEHTTAIQKEELFVADDRFLNKIAVNNGSSK